MEPVYKYYKPAWRSFYANFALMLLLLVLAGAVHYFKPEASWLKWMWIAVAVVEVLLFLYVALKRGMTSLILKDNPAKAEDQEVAFVVCHPLKPFSPNFRESIEIGLANIVHIKMGQTLMQAILNIGDIVVTSSGTGKEEIQAKNIPDPQAVRDEIQVHARKYTMPGSTAPTATAPAPSPEA